MKLVPTFDLTLVPEERFGGITFTSENGSQTRQKANLNIHQAEKCNLLEDIRDAPKKNTGFFGNFSQGPTPPPPLPPFWEPLFPKKSVVYFAF